jgi:predicted aspartyl protease
MVVIPVTLTYHGRSLTALMSVDTGASTTTIGSALAARLGISRDGAIAGSAQVADGRSVSYRTETLDVSVEGLQQSGMAVNIMEYSGMRGNVEGWLGLNFIKSFKLTLDLKNNRILWARE